MTLFELVKLTLDELYEEGKRDHGSKLDERITAKIKYLSSSYRSLTDAGRVPIDYRDSATRFAYVLKYVATHGDYVLQALDTFKSHDGPLFKEETARISCIGGGPGSDVIGVIKYLAENADEKAKKLTCYLLDGEQAWADTWTEVGDSIDSNVALNVNFQPLDVTKPSSWGSQKKFLQADLFTVSYFVSEVRAFDVKGAISDFWDKLFSEAKVGAKFLYVDNGHDEFNEFFDGFWQDRKDIKAVFREDNRTKIPRSSEQSGSLGAYKTKFGQQPRLKGMVSTRLLKKVK